ncbi:aminopeptidase N, partial [human gut metagenome]
AASPTMIQCLYSLWETERVQQLNERDYTTLAYELALRIPEQEKNTSDTTPTHPQSGPSTPIRFHITCDDCRYFKIGQFIPIFIASGKQKD